MLDKKSKKRFCICFRKMMDCFGEKCIYATFDGKWICTMQVVLQDRASIIYLFNSIIRRISHELCRINKRLFLASLDLAIARSRVHARKPLLISLRPCHALKISPFKNIKFMFSFKNINPQSYYMIGNIFMTTHVF